MPATLSAAEDSLPPNLKQSVQVYGLCSHTCGFIQVDGSAKDNIFYNVDSINQANDQ